MAGSTPVKDHGKPPVFTEFFGVLYQLGKGCGHILIKFSGNAQKWSASNTIEPVLPHIEATLCNTAVACTLKARTGLGHVGGTANTLAPVLPCVETSLHFPTTVASLFVYTASLPACP